MNVPVHLVGSHRRHIGKSLRLGSMGVGWSWLESAVNGQARTPWRGSGEKGGGTGSASGTGKGLGCAGRFIKLVSVGMGSVLKGCCEGWPWVVFCVRRVHCTLGYERLLNSSMTWQAVLVILFVWYWTQHRSFPQNRGILYPILQRPSTACTQVQYVCTGHNFPHPFTSPPIPSHTTPSLILAIIFSRVDSDWPQRRQSHTKRARA